MATIGAGIVVNGRLSGDEEVTVLGKIEGTIALENALIIDEQGSVVADVEAQTIAVTGSLEGDVVAHQRITLHNGCNVTGNLRAPRIVIEEGARFKGNVDMDVESA